jgi:hypothetical protein
MSLNLFKLLSGGEYEVINLNINTVEVRAGRRTIRAQWNPEMVQEIESYHNIDVEQELTRLLSEEIGREIDNQVMERIGLNVQRVFARTIAQDLVPVQPMIEPVFNTNYFFDYIYDGYSFKNFKILRG